jgi:acyl-CoA synthetase (AMP-forming)/AMP-acid ligase II
LWGRESREIILCRATIFSGYFIVTQRFIIVRIQGRSHDIKTIAIPSDVIFVADIPRNKAGKPVRALIKAKALGEALGDTSAVVNPQALDAIPLVVKK